jgi:hypothetical protein
MIIDVGADQLLAAFNLLIEVREVFFQALTHRANGHAWREPVLFRHAHLDQGLQAADKRLSGC